MKKRIWFLLWFSWIDIGQSVIRFNMLVNEQFDEFYWWLCLFGFSQQPYRYLQSSQQCSARVNYKISMIYNSVNYREIQLMLFIRHVDHSIYQH